MIITIPLRLESVANLREHWGARARRAKLHRDTTSMVVRAAWRGWLPLGEWSREELLDRGLVVTLARIALRTLDCDNLAAALKSVRDGVADALGLKSDADPRVAWRYCQRRGMPGEYAVEVRIEGAQCLN